MHMSLPIRMKRGNANGNGGAAGVAGPAKHARQKGELKKNNMPSRQSELPVQEEGRYEMREQATEVETGLMRESTGQKLDQRGAEMLI
jgi:hypothetical protein